MTITGAVGAVVTLADTHRALAHPGRGADRHLVICDLGMPRDVEQAVAGLPGVTLLDMESLQQDPASGAAASDADAAREIVASELANYLAGQRLAEVTPTVTALRQRAAEVVEAELMRLVRRVVDKLLHAPTVRVKQLASTPGGDQYAEALRELFELRPGTAAAVTTPMDLTTHDISRKDGQA